MRQLSQHKWGISAKFSNRTAKPPSVVTAAGVDIGELALKPASSGTASTMITAA